MAHYGIGTLTAVTILAELGDCRRFSSSRHAVRYSGLDITVHQSDQRRAPGHLSRQGPPALRWALFEAPQVARRPTGPDRDYYTQAADQLGGNRACLAVARNLLKRSHTLRELGERPQRFLRDHPINHLVADSEPPRAEDRDKAGRPRAHTLSDSAATAPVKRSALGPAGRPRGDRAPRPPQPGRRACRGDPAQITSRSSCSSTRWRCS
jgi:hypothetical protein